MRQICKSYQWCGCLELLRQKLYLMRVIQSIDRKGTQMSEHIIHVTDATFEAEVLKAAEPVLLDFWAPWCGPCKMIAPILDQLAQEWAGKVKVVKMNVDENQVVPAQFGIRSIPTLVVLKDGKVLANRSGALAKPQLEAFVNASING